jgi:hypothetical protein
MVLDPADMNGLGPPSTRRISHVPRARPYAYVFVDTPYEEASVPEGREESAAATVSVACKIENIEVVSEAGRAAEPWMKVKVASPRPDRNDVHVVVDRDLVLLDVETVSGPLTDNDASWDYWNTRWRPVFRNGRPVSK